MWWYRYAVAVTAIFTLACSGDNSMSSDAASDATSTTTSGSASTGTSSSTTGTGATQTSTSTTAGTNPTTTEGSTGGSTGGSTSEGFTGAGILMTLVEGENVEFIEWAEMNGNYANCDQVDTELDLRFAESPDQNGEAGRYIDIKVCGYQGVPASFFPLDPDTPCGGETGFKVGWHGASGTYDNPADAMGCIFNTQTEAPLIGASLVCGDLDDGMGGTASIVESAMVCPF